MAGGKLPRAGTFAHLERAALAVADADSEDDAAFARARRDLEQAAADWVQRAQRPQDRQGAAVDAASPGRRLKGRRNPI